MWDTLPGDPEYYLLEEHSLTSEDINNHGYFIISSSDAYLQADCAV